jgi:hypothetical protein
MTTKGTLWIWLSLLAIRGLAVFCFYWNAQQRNAELQQEGVSAETHNVPPPHHHRINQVHAAGISFFVLI